MEKNKKITEKEKYYRKVGLKLYILLPFMFVLGQLSTEFSFGITITIFMLICLIIIFERDGIVKWLTKK
jgi:hypothetical protein